jgi:hypothetical protein
LFGEEITGTTVTTPKTVLSSSPDENSFSSSETKHNRTAQGTIYFFGEEVTETKVTNPNNALGSRLGEDVGFREDDDNFLHDIQRYVPNNQAYGKLSGNTE